jgi:hypothetical protein
MKAIAEGGPWIDDYLARKGTPLREIAQGLRRLMKRTVPDCKETVNPWKLPTLNRMVRCAISPSGKTT